MRLRGGRRLDGTLQTAEKRKKLRKRRTELTFNKTKKKKMGRRVDLLEVCGLLLLLLSGNCYCRGEEEGRLLGQYCNTNRAGSVHLMLIK